MFTGTYLAVTKSKARHGVCKGWSNFARSACSQETTIPVNSFERRHIGPGEKDKQKMLATCGFKVRLSDFKLLADLII
ncbi:unnamed protein product [Protopolystoma xenopodis]|uniref:Uncharacterized protein n=1 Tax=Protopolystoma xenopodis TaxID=117903 RepID=A0A448WX78_9PLAT|nr:unnamed protein product [Protopolystoma xenopodis]